MKRRWLSVVGGFFVLTAVGYAITLVAGDAIGVTGAVTAGALAVVGVLFVLAGEGRATVGLEWYQLAGLGNVALGCWFGFRAGTYLPGDPGPPEWVLIGGFGLAGVAFVFIGVDWLRGGYHYDVEWLEPGPLTGE